MSAPSAGRDAEPPPARATDLKASAKTQKPLLQPNGLAVPTRTFFDPWNSASTGHQRAENRLAGSTSWRDSRNFKLGAQYKAGATGGERLFDTVGAGSKDFGRDGRKVNGGWHRGAAGLRSNGQKALWECTPEPAIGKRKRDDVDIQSSKHDESTIDSYSESKPVVTNNEDIDSVTQDSAAHLAPADEGSTGNIDADTPQIFRSLTFYINGSTAPAISDHRLKFLLAAHGGNLSIALGRRTVTHVILGTVPGSGPGACGGGLAATKIQKEATRVGGKGVKYVSASWVMESIKAGKRLPESKFAKNIISVAPSGQRSVLDLFGSSKRKDERADGKG